MWGIYPNTSPINDCTNRSRSAAARAPMIPDLDIWRSANLLVKRHGQDAPIEDAMRADAVLEEGGLGGYGVVGPPVGSYL